MITGGNETQAFASTFTDLMTSIAVIFILLLVVFLKQSSDQARRAKEIMRIELYDLLHEEGLTLEQVRGDPLTLAISLGENQIKFAHNSDQLPATGSEFIGKLFQDLGPRVCGGKLSQKIDSIVIEGHTDRSGEVTLSGARHNIKLSQERSFSVLDYALAAIEPNASVYRCLLKLISATGKGSANPLFTNGDYDPDKSRRVEIKLRVKSKEQALLERLGTQIQPRTVTPSP